MKKTKRNLTTFAWALLMAGVFIFLMGVYYLLFKAGIPYQDPTPEQQLRYTIDVEIGDVLIDNGLIVFAVGLIATIVAKGESK